jgi:hypothetical protein
LLILKAPLEDAMMDREVTGISPTDIDRLGYKLNFIVGDAGRSDLPDSGRSLAEATLAHIITVAKSKQ